MKGNHVPCCPSLPPYTQAVCGTTFGEAAELFSDIQRKDLEIKVLRAWDPKCSWEYKFTFVPFNLYALLPIIFHVLSKYNASTIFYKAYFFLFTNIDRSMADLNGYVHLCLRIEYFGRKVWIKGRQGSTRCLNNR